MASSAKPKVPASLISLAALTNTPNAARQSAEPTLIRATPASARSSTPKVAPGIPITTLTGLVTEPHTALMVSRS